MVKDLWVNMDRFSEMTKDLGDVGIEDIKKYAELSQQLGSKDVNMKEAIFAAVTNPEEFQDNIVAMEAEVNARSGQEQSTILEKFAFGDGVGAESEFKEAVDKMREGINNPEGNAAMANMQKEHDPLQK